MFLPNLKLVSSPVPEIIAIGVLGGVANPQYWGRGGSRGLGCCTVEHLTFTRYCGNRIEVRWKILFYRILQFIYESKSERIIEIGPHLPKLS